VLASLTAFPAQCVISPITIPSSNLSSTTLDVGTAVIYVESHFGYDPKAVWFILLLIFGCWLFVKDTNNK
jgi:hypothetical protein